MSWLLFAVSGGVVRIPQGVDRQGEVETPGFCWCWLCPSPDTHDYCTGRARFRSPKTHFRSLATLPKRQ